MNDPNMESGATQTGFLDWRMNGLMVSNSIDSIVQESAHPLIH